MSFYLACFLLFVTFTHSSPSPCPPSHPINIANNTKDIKNTISCRREDSLKTLEPHSRFSMKGIFCKAVQKSSPSRSPFIDRGGIFSGIIFACDFPPSADPYNLPLQRQIHLLGVLDAIKLAGEEEDYGALVDAFTTLDDEFPSIDPFKILFLDKEKNKYRSLARLRRVMII